MQPNRKIAVASKAAIYAKSAVADLNAINARVKICKEYAEQENMEVDPSHVYSDSGVSGRTLDQRPALTAMLAAACTQPRPFDVVLVDTTDHFAPSIVVMHSVVQQLTKAGVALIVVGEHLDSRDPNFLKYIVMFGSVGDEYLSRLGDEVRRGQEGRVRAGMIPGGHCYGYRNVPVEHAGDNGKARIIGYKREIVTAEAEVIQRIFTLYTSGVIVREIAHRMNDDGIPGPAARLGSAASLWSPRPVRAILRNIAYRGVTLWGKTCRRRDPMTDKIRTAKTPPEMWVTHTAPELRIVSDEQFKQAQKIQKARKKRQA